MYYCSLIIGNIMNIEIDKNYVFTYDVSKSTLIINKFSK